MNMANSELVALTISSLILALGVFGLLVFACFTWAHKRHINVKSTLNAIDFVPTHSASLYDSVKIVPFQQNPSGRIRV